MYNVCGISYLASLSFALFLTTLRIVYMRMRVIYFFVKVENLRDKIHVIPQHLYFLLQLVAVAA